MAGGWTRIDNAAIGELPRLGANAFAVYAVLAYRANSKTGQCWPKVKTIAADAGLKPRAVQYALAKLQAAGLVHVEVRGRAPNLYTVMGRADGNPLAAKLARKLTAPPADVCTGVHPRVHHHAPLGCTTMHPRTRNKNKKQEQGNQTKENQPRQTAFEFWETILAEELGRAPTLREVEIRMAQQDARRRQTRRRG